MRHAVEQGTTPAADEHAGAETHGLVKLFGSTPALLRVDLSVPRGTVCGLLGGNGAGKTTLLRILASALRPTSGGAFVLGFETRREAAAVRQLTDYLPPAGGVYPELSALENLRFATGMRGLALGDVDLEAALSWAGLASAANDPVRTFSSGMLRRLALARLALTRPRLALLDEPYAALDEEGRELVDALLGETRREGRTALVATHEEERIGLVSDQLCRLERGIVVHCSPVAEGLERRVEMVP